MTEIIVIQDWSEWISSTWFSEGYSLSENETVQDVIAKFVKKHGYEPEKVFVKGNQVRIDLEDK